MTSIKRSLQSTIVLFGVATLLWGCSTARYQGDENSPFYAIPAGSRVVLTQALAIPPEQVGVFIQNGKVTPWSQINQYYAHCKFEVRDLKTSEQRVNPDEFLVTRVVQDVIQMLKWGRWQVAEASSVMRVSSKDDGGPSVMTYATYMYLGSERQPRVFRLGCGHWDYPGRRSAEYLSIAQMRKALGELITLQLPAKGGG
jgi:hypothetical protein